MSSSRKGSPQRKKDRTMAAIRLENNTNILWQCDWWGQSLVDPDEAIHMIAVLRRSFFGPADMKAILPGGGDRNREKIALIARKKLINRGIDPKGLDFYIFEEQPPTGGRGVPHMVSYAETMRTAD